MGFVWDSCGVCVGFVWGLCGVGRAVRGGGFLLSISLGLPRSPSAARRLRGRRRKEAKVTHLHLEVSQGSVSVWADVEP